MDPITLATITSAVVNLALEAAKEVAPQAAKDAWAQVKRWFGWDELPQPQELAPAIATRLKDDDELVGKITALLKKKPAGAASILVGSITAEQVVVAQKINTLHM